VLDMRTMSYFGAALSGRVRRLALCVALSGAGAGVARLLQPADSHACVCSPPSWDVELRSVAGSDGAPDHTGHWVPEGELSVEAYGERESASVWLLDEERRGLITIEAFND
jgi:hypothetical protein